MLAFTCQHSHSVVVAGPPSGPACIAPYSVIATGRIPLEDPQAHLPAGVVTVTFLKRR